MNSQSQPWFATFSRVVILCTCVLHIRVIAGAQASTSGIAVDIDEGYGLDSSVRCSAALASLATVAKGERSVLVNTLHVFEEAFVTLDNEDSPMCEPTAATADHRLEYARLLKQAGRYDSSLQQLNRIIYDTRATAKRDQLDQDIVAHVVASVDFEKGFVLVCADRIDDAIEAQSRSFESVSVLFESPHSQITERDIQARMLEIVKLFKWKGGEYNSDADAMLSEIVPTHPRQWPVAHYNDDLLSVARPWFDSDGDALDREWARGIGAIRGWLQDHHTSLQHEYTTLAEQQLVHAQRECLHDPHGTTWRQHSLTFNEKRKPSSGCSDESLVSSPVACAFVSWMNGEAKSVGNVDVNQNADEGATDDQNTGHQTTDHQTTGDQNSGDKHTDDDNKACESDAHSDQRNCGAATTSETLFKGVSELHTLKMELMRIGYSVVEGDGHIRPHTGPTNEQLKLHYGVIVPTGTHPCRWLLTVAGDARPWVERQTLLFDDSFEHEVSVVCDGVSVDVGDDGVGVGDDGVDVGDDGVDVGNDGVDVGDDDVDVGDAPLRVVLQLVFKHPHVN